MDIITWGGPHLVGSARLLRLRRGQESWIWRGQEPVQAQVDQSRVYFVEKGAIYLYATYGGYDSRSSSNLQGNHQSGPAILLITPVKRVDPPLLLDPIDRTILRAPFRWRYDRWTLRQYI